MVILPLLFLAGCGQKLPEFNVMRDVYSTGGDISFLWVNDAKTAYFGGENEVIQYYEQDIAKGFLKAGNRVGLKIVFSEKISDLGSLTFKIGKEEINGEEVATKIDDEVVYFQLFPIVESAGQRIEIKIDYKGKKDKIIVKIHEKSILMENLG